MKISTLVWAFVGTVVVVGVLWFVLGQAHTQNTGATPVGNTFNDAKIAAITFTPSSASATTTSILNPSGQDVYVTGGFAGCSNATTSYTAITGTGLRSWNIQAATTSTANPANVTNTNLVMNLNIATGTSAAGGAPFNTILAATTSVATTSGLVNNVGANAYWFVWPASTYLTFVSNATNTAACTVGVSYFSS